MARLDRLLPLLMARVSHRTRVPGIGPAAMMVLRRLRFSSVCTVSELAEWMGVTSATVTGITNNLAGQDLIFRWREEDDRRVVRIRLTEEGSRVLTDFEHLRKEKVNALLDTLNHDDLRQLAEIIERLVEEIKTE
jgi:DNA-binding MarR family transcriptional regulator